MDTQQQLRSDRSRAAETDALLGKVPRDKLQKVDDMADSATSTTSSVAAVSKRSSRPTLPKKFGAKSMSNVFDQSMIYSDEAEDAVLSTVEERAKYTHVGEDGFRPAVKGELPPLRVQNLGIIQNLNSFRSHGSSRRSSEPSVQRAASIHMQRMGLAAIRHKTAKTDNHKGRHRRAKTLLMDVGKGIDMTPISDVFGYKDDENSSSSGSSCNERSTLNTEEDERYPDEGLPLLSGTQILSERKLKARKLLEKNEWKMFMRMLNPTVIAQRLYHWFVHSSLIVAIPLFIIAFVLFYVCGNPYTPDYIPGKIRFSWWLDFIGE